MADMKLFLELLVKNSGFRSELNNSGSAVSRFTKGAKQEFDSLRSSIHSAGGLLAGLGVSFGVVRTLAASAQMDKGLTQIGQTAGEGADKVAGLRKELFRMGQATGQDINSLQSGFNALVQSGLNMKESNATLDGINIAMAVTGARAETLAAGLGVAATAFNFDLAKPGQALDLLDKMTVAGRLGNAELQNLSDIFARVGVNANSAGFSFEKTLGFIEALSKVERQPERLATLADSTLRVFTNMRYMASAQAGTGIRFYDTKGGRRDPLTVLGDIKKKYDTLKTDMQRDMFVQKAFGQADLDTIKGIRTLLSSNNLSEVAKFTGLIKDAGGTLNHDLVAAIDNAVDQTGRLRNALKLAADDFAQPINGLIADLIKWSMDKKEKGGLGLSGKEMAGYGLAIMGGTALAARFGSKFLGEWAQKKLGTGITSTGLGVVQGKALQEAAGVTPVFVVNAADMGGGLGAGAGAGPGSIAALAALVPFAIAAGMASIPAIVTAIVGGSSVAVGKGITDRQVSRQSTQWLEEQRMRHMVMGGGTSSYQVQAIDAELASRRKELAKLDDARRDVFGSSKVRNDIKLDVRIDRDGRVIATSNDMNTTIDGSASWGAFEDAILRPSL
jgi:TP901 family phage tail tape measure protein